MGAWIEITILLSQFVRKRVAPYMGAWIEILEPLIGCRD